MLIIKEGVDLTNLKTEMLVAIMIMNECCADLGVDCTITSGCDGRHMDGSRHYKGEAVDFRLREMGDDTAREVVIDFLDRTAGLYTCLLYTSPSPRDGLLSRMPSSA